MRQGWLSPLYKWNQWGSEWLVRWRDTEKSQGSAGLLVAVTVPGGSTADRTLPCRTVATGPAASNRSSAYRLLFDTHDNCGLWVLSATPLWWASGPDFREIREWKRWGVHWPTVPEPALFTAANPENKCTCPPVGAARGRETTCFL